MKTRVRVIVHSESEPKPKLKPKTQKGIHLQVSAHTLFWPRCTQPLRVFLRRHVSSIFIHLCEFSIPLDVPLKDKNCGNPTPIGRISHCVASVKEKWVRREGAFFSHLPFCSLDRKGHGSTSKSCKLNNPKLKSSIQPHPKNMLHLETQKRVSQKPANCSRILVSKTLCDCTNLKLGS